MLNSINEILDGVSRMAIAGHVRPDGDCVGSVLGLYNYISENMPDIQVDVFLESFEKHFNFLSGSDRVHNSSLKDEVKYDLFVILDCDSDRIADFAKKYFETAEKTACIDHHVTNNHRAGINHVLPEISSASEVLFELLEPEKISKKTAECLYVGIIHDTGCLKYQSTTSHTLNVVGRLMDKGIDYTNITDDTFYKKTYLQNVVMGRCLINSRLLLDGKLIYSYADRNLLDEYGISNKELGGIIDQLRFTEGVEVALFIYDLKDGRTKGSLRSINVVDVNLVANELGGGGHVRAAGFTTDIPAETAIKKVEELVARQLEVSDNV